MGIQLKITELIAVLLSLTVAATLLWSGFVHLSGPYFFLESVLAYEVLPKQVAWVAAAILVHLVLVLGLATGSRLFRPGSYLLCIVLFLTFALAQLFAYLTNKPITCGCFGPSDTKIGLASISVPVVLFLVSIILFFVDRPSKEVIHKESLIDAA